MKQRAFQFNIVAFFVAFAIGMIYVFLNVPPLKYVITYPTPYNVGGVVYKDPANTCYVYDAQKLECPKDATKIKQQPIIE